MDTDTEPAVVTMENTNLRMICVYFWSIIFRIFSDNKAALYRKVFWDLWWAYLDF